MAYQFKMKQGFSLMELLVVILIVSLIYFLGFDGFSSSNVTKSKETPLDMLKNLTQQTYKGKLICTDGCQTCFLKETLNSDTKKIDKKFNFGQDISIYKLDNSHTLQKVEFGRYNDHKICMIVDFYQNGSHTKFVLQNKSSIYFIGSFFDDIQEVNSLDEAQKLWVGDINALHNGDFF